MEGETDNPMVMQPTQTEKLIISLDGNLHTFSNTICRETMDMDVERYETWSFLFRRFYVLDCDRWKVGNKFFESTY